MRFFTFLFFIFPLYSGVAYSQDILWEKSYGGKHAEFLFDVLPTPDNGFILAGSSISKKSGNKTEENRGDLDYWIWKMDEKGDLDWQKSFGGSDQDKLKCVLLTDDGGILIAGSSESTVSFDKDEKNIGFTDFWILKLNPKGDIEWQKTIGGNGQDELNTIVKTYDGGFVIGGSSNSKKSGDKTTTTFGGMDYWIVKVNNEGKIVWQNTFGGIYNDELISIAVTLDGGFILGGYSNSPNSGNKLSNNHGDSDYWIIKIDKVGKYQWQKTIGGKSEDQLAVVQTLTDGNYLVGGNSKSEVGLDKQKSNQNGTDIWILKLDNEGDIIWQEILNIGKVDVLTSMVVNDDKTILLGGYAQGEIKNNKNPIKKIKGKKHENSIKVQEGTDDYIAIKLNEKGEEIWRKDVGSDGQDILKKVIEVRDGGYLFAGTSSGKVSNEKKSNIGSYDYWVVKLKDSMKPDKKKLSIEAIPNPAINFTNLIIGYDFDYGTATLVDITGRVIQKFVIENRTVPIDLQGLPKGIYIVNVKTDKQSDGVKIIKN